MLARGVLLSAGNEAAWRPLTSHMGCCAGAQGAGLASVHHVVNGRGSSIKELGWLAAATSCSRPLAVAAALLLCRLASSSAVRLSASAAGRPLPMEGEGKLEAFLLAPCLQLQWLEKQVSASTLRQVG